MNKEDLKLLKKLLPHGSIKKIADKIGMSQQSVSKVLGGDWANPAITKAAITLLQKEHTKITKLLDRLTMEDESEQLGVVA